MRTEKLTGPDVASLMARARRALGDDAMIVSLARTNGAFELVAAGEAKADEEIALLTAPLPSAAVANVPAASAAVANVASASATVAPVVPAPRVAVAAAPPTSAWEHASHTRFAGPYVPNDSIAAPTRAAALAPRPQAAPTIEVMPPTQPAPRHMAAPGAWRMRPGIPVRRNLSGTPPLIALVGPTGSGKTTTIAKLANHVDVFGGWPIGLLCLDTYRIGAFEQLRAYAELSELPIEVAHEPGEVEAALRRLGDCDVVLVDTAGRGPRQAGMVAKTLEPLRALGPMEVHLTLPAGLRLDHARRLVEHHRPLGLTHLLATKLDECLGDDIALQLAAETGLAMRWACHGQEVPQDLGSAERLRAERRRSAA